MTFSSTTATKLAEVFVFFGWASEDYYELSKLTPNQRRDLRVQKVQADIKAAQQELLQNKIEVAQQEAAHAAIYFPKTNAINQQIRANYRAIDDQNKKIRSANESVQRISGEINSAQQKMKGIASQIGVISKELDKDAFDEFDHSGLDSSYNITAAKLKVLEKMKAGDKLVPLDVVNALVAIHLNQVKGNTKSLAELKKTFKTIAAATSGKNHKQHRLF